VLHRLLTAPYALTDINSWLLFALGFVFSLIAMADGLMFFDPYMGYAGLERRWNEAPPDLSVRRSEYDSLLQGRVRLAQHYHQNQNQIEQTSRALLEICRES